MTQNIITALAIRQFKARFSNLVDLGLMDDDYAIAVLGADKMGCRACDVRIVDRQRHGALVEQICRCH